MEFQEKKLLRFTWDLLTFKKVHSFSIKKLDFFLYLTKGGLISDLFSISKTKKMWQITLGEYAQDSDLAHFFEDGAKVKNFQRFLSHL